MECEKNSARAQKKKKKKANSTVSRLSLNNINRSRWLTFKFDFETLDFVSKVNTPPFASLLLFIAFLGWLMNESIDLPSIRAKKQTGRWGGRGEAISLRLILCSARFLRVYTNGWIPPSVSLDEKERGRKRRKHVCRGIFTTSQGHKVVLSLCSWFSGKDGVRTHSRA